MEKQLNSENKVENSVRPQNKHLVPFKRGDPKINRDGHKKGQKNYATLRREALIEIGKANGKSPEEIEIMLHSKAIAEAMKGNYQFYKDDLDRLHGKAQENLNINAEVVSKVIKLDE